MDMTYGEALPELTGMRMLTAWEFRPLVVLVLALATALYVVGVRRLRARGESWSVARSLSFGLGVVALAVSLMSFIAVYDTSLFLIHMVQHLMLIMVTPALLAGGGVLQLLMAASRGRAKERFTAFFENRVVRTLISAPLLVVYYAATVVGTHLTGFMHTVMMSENWTNFEHVLYLVVGFLYFVPVFASWPTQRAFSFPSKLLMVVLTMPVDAFTGVVLTMGNSMIMTTRDWGPSPVSDLNWGGGVMWLGGGLIMATMIFALAAEWMTSKAPASGGSTSIFERARMNHMMGADADGTVNLDDDEAVLAAYNARLQQKYGTKR